VKRTSIVAVAVFAVSTITFVLLKAASMLADREAAPAAILFALGVASPFLPLLAAAVLARTRAESAAALVGILASAAFGFSVYLDGLVLRPRPLNALLFVVVPSVQWGIGLATLLAEALLRLIGRARRAE